MSKWIDVDALKADLDKGLWGKDYDKALAEAIIDSAPSIDIVRCKECKKAHLTYDGTCKYCDEWKDDDGNYIEVYHDGDHFCSYGCREERSGE